MKTTANRVGCQARSEQRGVAFILVLTILLALTVLAVPFLMIARNDSAAASSQLSRAEAKLRAEATIRYGRNRLRSGHRSLELRNAGSGGAGNVPGQAPQTPDVDTPDEFEVPSQLTNKDGQPLRDGDGVALMYHRDERGMLCDLTVRDEQSLPNLLSAGPFLIASALGRSSLTDKIIDSDTEISVEDATGFPKKNGRLLVEGELVSYEELDGNTFRGCQRGLAGGLKAEEHAEDAWVLDERARQIAMLPFRSPRAGGGWREPIKPTFIKEVALLGEVALTPVEVDRITEQFTTMGRRFNADGFGPESTVTDPIDPSNDDGNGFVIRVNDHEPFNFGTIVRITDRVRTEYLMVAESRFGQIRVFEAPKNTYDADRTFVAPLLRHPVNMNSADRETLVRILDGVQSRFGPGGGGSGTLGRLDRDGAEDVADAILQNRPIKDFRQFRKILEDVMAAHPIDFNQILAVATFANALRPNHADMVRSSVPFCFRSFDNYTLSSTAVLNDGSGREVARHWIRERVHVAPSGPSSLTLDTQSDFENGIYRARLGRWVATHPLPTARIGFLDAVQPFDRVPRMLYRFGGLTTQEERPIEDQEDVKRSGQDGMWGDEEFGDVRLLTARMNGADDHFDGPAFFLGDRNPLERIDPSGYILAKGPYDLGTGGGGGGRAFRARGGVTRQGGGSVGGNNGPNPVRVDFWLNLGKSVGSRHVLYDYAGADTNEDRIQLVLESDGSLRARVYGRTLDDTSDNFEEVAETRWDPPSPGYWRADTPYHFGIAYRGTRPSDVQLFVDGYLRGRPRYLTKLTAGTSADSRSFSVEYADDWPDRGVALIGGQEAVVFERNGQSLQAVDGLGDSMWGRGRRGTKRAAHAAGAPVTLLGYSLLPVGAVTHNRTTAPVITRGGAKLTSALGPMVLGFIAEANKPAESPPGTLPGAIPPPPRVDVHDPAEPEGDRIRLGPAGTDFSCFPERGGYIMIVSRGIGHVPGVREIAYYGSRSGDTLLGLADASGLPNPLVLAAAPTAPPAAGTTGGGVGGSNAPGLYTTRQRHPVSLTGDPLMTKFVAVFPISINVSGSEGLRTPEEVMSGGGGAAAQPTWHTWPEVVQLGLTNYRDLDNHDIEWIRYHHISGQGDLCMDELPVLEQVSTLLQGALPNIDFLVYVQQLANLFPFRSQGGTAQLLDDPSRLGGSHSANEDVIPCFRTVSYARTAAHPQSRTPSGNPVVSPNSGQALSPAGWGDSVTIEDRRRGARVRAKVAWAGSLSGPGPSSNGLMTGQGWIGFDQPVGRDFRQGTLPTAGEQPDGDRTDYVRILKFPSGEMPLIARGARAVIAGESNGTSTLEGGTLDEVRVTDFARGGRPDTGIVVWNDAEMDFASDEPRVPGGVDASTDEIPLALTRWMVSNAASFNGTAGDYTLPDGRRVFADAAVEGLPQNNAGLVLIDEEVIAFRTVGANRLLGCQRGFMNTVPSAHGYGAEVVYLSFIPVSMLTAGLDPDGNALDLALAPGFNAQGGLVMVDQEAIHYTRVDQNRLVMPWALGEGGVTEGGLFRGRFGTKKTSHDSEAIVFEMPFRYWDRYANRQDSSELSWYGVSLDLPGVFFHQLRFDEYRPDATTDIEVLCRIRSDIPWTADPRTTAGLFLFEDSDEKSPAVINQTGDGLEVRVYFRYLDGAMLPSTMDAHGWKLSPELRSFGVTWYDETRVLDREASR